MNFKKLPGDNLDCSGSKIASTLWSLISSFITLILSFSLRITLTSKDHRPAYGSDGDYFSKPSKDDIIESIYNVMNEYNPSKYPSII